MVLVLTAFAGAIAAVRVSLPDRTSGLVMQTDADAPPVMLASLTPAVAAHYQHAADHEHAYVRVPCYCGCDSFADHRNLYDCFIRADGAGYEAHGAGCAICQAEARQVRRLNDAGHSPTEIRARIIEQFGPATNPAGTAGA